MAWGEVTLAEKEKRRELVLRGQQISKRIDADGLDPTIFKLFNLNYLEISGTSLTAISSDVGQLVNLTSLVLCNNQLTEVPISVAKLTKLKTLNLSNNKIETIPVEICRLGELDTLNLGSNQLTELPAMADLKSIHVLNLSNNKLSELPEGVDDPSLVHLSQLLAGDNEMTELTAELQDLPHLNHLDLSNNKFTEAPAYLCNCLKLKELDLKGNKFKDRRFGKLVNQKGTKSVMEYLEIAFQKENQKADKGKEKEKKTRKKKKKTVDEVDEIAKDMLSILKFPSEDTGVVISVTPAVLSVRQYIVCCLVRNLDLQGTKNMFKNFITLQTKLHDTVCQKRQAATIATHAFKSCKLPLKYDAKFPQALMITPLFKRKEVSGEKLFENLRREADELRKEKKRNTFSGIHKYLDLLADKTQYPCLVDSEDRVISFPPITNSDITKISPETTDILVEVTSSTNLDTCKKIMDELLYKMLDMGLGSPAKGDNSKGACAKGGDSSSEDSDDGVVFEGEEGGAKKTTKSLVVEQVKIIDNEGGLKVLYPSRTDLQNEGIKVIRSFD